MSQRRTAGGFMIWGLLVALAALNVYQYVTRPPKVEPPKANDRDARQAIIDSFHQLYYNNARTWSSNTWLGIPAWQNPNDAWMIQEIFAEVVPDVVVETGTAHGGGALYWASVLEQINPEGRVLTIDIEDKSAEARELPLWKERIDFLLGSSTAPEILAEVEAKVAGKKVVLILDSNHAADHVARELELYSPFIGVGSYIIVQDTNLNGHPVGETGEPGPWEGRDAFLATTQDFEIDLSRERLLFTMHPSGYLKRVR